MSISPKFKIATLQPEGIVRHIFDVKVDVVLKILKQYSHLEQTLKMYSSFFGTLTQEGLIQIWGVGLFCRCVLKLPTGHSNCSWATIRVINEQATFFVYSRGHGVHIETLTECSPLGVLGTTLLQFAPRANAGFSKPICHESNEVKYMDDDDNLIQVNPTSQTFKFFKFPGVTHITFFTAFDLHQNLILIGSESGKVVLLNLTHQPASLLEEVDFLKNDIVEKSKRRCNEPADENMAIPLCCVGDENTGNFLVGTRANVLVLLNLHVSEKLTTLQVTKAKGIPNPGVHSMLLHPDKDKVLVHGWDFKVRVFRFPSMDFIQSFEWPIHPVISAMSFLSIPKDSDSNLVYLILATDSPQVMTMRILEIPE